LKITKGLGKSARKGIIFGDTSNAIMTMNKQQNVNLCVYQLLVMI
jgi:hypothetical protein